jgi:hypothetical protein
VPPVGAVRAVGVRAVGGVVGVQAVVVDGEHSATSFHHPNRIPPRGIPHLRPGARNGPP